jgi:hypothetical protein
MTEVKGLIFEKAFSKSEIYNDRRLLVRTLHKNDPIAAKKASKLSKDLDDPAI